MRKGTPLLTILAVVLLAASACAHPGQEPERFRVVILTDMTHDDGNSLIRFLYYAPYFDLEAMIVTNQLPDFNYDDEGPWEKAMGILLSSVLGLNDPDGDPIRFNWFRYHEADSYPGKIEPENAANPVQAFKVPDDIGNHDIHLVLEVRDTGSPPLVSYRRVVITRE